MKVLKFRNSEYRNFSEAENSLHYEAFIFSKSGYSKYYVVTHNVSKCIVIQYDVYLIPSYHHLHMSIVENSKKKNKSLVILLAKK